MSHLLAKHTDQDSKNLTGAQRQNLILRHLRNFTQQMAVTIFGFAVASLALGALIYQNSQNNVVPYVITVDSHGVVLNKGAAKPLTEITQEMVSSQLCDFIRSLRILTTDKTIQRQSIIKAYAFVKPGSSVAQQLTDYYKLNNPFDIKANQSVVIDVSSAIETGSNTYQIDWLEQGLIPGKAIHMRAQISYALAPSLNTNSQDPLLNPLGIFVESLVISEIL